MTLLPLLPKNAAFAAEKNESPLIRCAAHSARISEVGTPHTFSVYDLKKSSKSRRPKRFDTQSSSESSTLFRRSGGAQVRRHAARQLDRPELADHVRPAQRVVEEAVVPVDARHARAQQELLAEDLVPERVHLDRLREEAMAAEVEAVAVPLDGLREAADLVLGLEHDDVPPRPLQQVARGQARRAAAEDERRLEVSIVMRATRAKPPRRGS